MRALVWSLCWVVGCAPVTTTKRILTTPRPSTIARDAPVATGKLELTPADGGVLVASLDTLTCAEHDVTVTHRIEETRRQVATPVTVFEYILGLGLGGAGGYAIGDPHGAGTATGVPLQDGQIRTAGELGAGVGALFLTFAIINSFRGGTTTRDLGNQSRPSATSRSLACGTSPRAGDGIALGAGTKTWVLGSTTKDGTLVVAWSSIPDEVFDEDWHAAKVSAPSGSKPIDLTASRAAAAERAWTTLAASPSLAELRRYHTRFAGSHDADVEALQISLADRDDGKATADAIARADITAAKQALAAWSADAPTSTKRIEQDAVVAELERRGPIEYLYGKYELAMAGAPADADPAKLDEADRALGVLAQLAADEPRIAPARTALAKRRTDMIAARGKAAHTHADLARHWARHAKYDQADLELAAAVALAPQDPAVTAAVDYVAKTETAAGVTAFAIDKASVEKAKAKAEAERVEKQRIADEAKAKADATRAEQQRIVDEAKAKAEEARAATAAEKARIADETKAKAEEARAEKARLADEAKAKAEEARAATAAEKARLADEAKAKADEARATTVAEKARIADEAKARAEAARAKADADKAAREAARAKADADKAAKDAARAKIVADQRAKDDLARTKPAKAKPPRTVAAAERANPVAGVWSAAGRTPQGHVTLLLDASAAGSGAITIVGASGRALGRQPIRWHVERDKLSMAGGTLRGDAIVRGDAMTWSGYAWHRVGGRTVLATKTAAHN